MSSSNITITVTGEHAKKPINYRDPALGNSTDCLGVHNYKYNDKDNVKFMDNKENTTLFRSYGKDSPLMLILSFSL